MTAHAERLPTARATTARAVSDWLARNSLLVTFIALLGTVMIGLAPELFVSDSWMTLLAGREIAQHGLPAHETLTTWPLGRTWTDQQWLAQLLFYGADRLGGLRLAVLFHVSLVTLAFGAAVAAARLRGATPRSTLLLVAICVFVAPWSWQLRAQAIGLPLFVWTLALISSDVRLERRRTLLVFPILILWANVHGSVTLGAALVAIAGLLGLGELVLRRPTTAVWWRSALLLVAPWICVLASPYSYHLIGYYRLLFLDSPATKVIVEWQAPKPNGYLLVFFAVAAATVALTIWKRRRLAVYDIGVIALTLVGALRSGRGIVWFSLAVVVLLPVALDGVLGTKESAIRRRLGLVLSTAFVALLVVTLGVLVPRGDSWYARLWPPPAAHVVATTAHALPANATIYPGDTHGDWLVWQEPSLRGRITFDVRFELLNGREITAIRHFKSMKPDWRTALGGVRIVVLDRANSQSQIKALRAEPGSRVLYEDNATIAIERPQG